MWQALINIFAVFGAGCFIAGGVVASIVFWAYLELSKEDKQERTQERTPVPPSINWQKRMEEEFSLDPHL